MVGYTRDTETKYHDRVLEGGWAGAQVSKHTGEMNTTPGSNFVVESENWFPIIIGMPVPPANPYDNYPNIGNLLTGPSSGTGVNERIGLKIKVKWMKIRLTFNAMNVESDSYTKLNDQNGEVILDGVNSTTPSVRSLMRTTFRVCVVMDTAVNAVVNNTPWREVMETYRSGQSGMGGPHSEPRVDNLGRYRILSDRTFELDMDTPQKTMTVMLRNIGDVRYNSDLKHSYTSKGIWVIYSAMTAGNMSNTADIPPTVTMSSVVLSRRMAYTDA